METWEYPPVPRAYKTAEYATQEAMNGTAAFVFHNGDISYARGICKCSVNLFLGTGHYLCGAGGGGIFLFQHERKNVTHPLSPLVNS